MECVAINIADVHFLVKDFKNAGVSVVAHAAMRCHSGYVPVAAASGSEGRQSTHVAILGLKTPIPQLNGSVKEPSMFHNCETEKITHKASNAAENLQLCRAVQFFCPRSSCTMHLMLFSERLRIYA